MTNAQIWLNQTIPINQRNNIRELYIWPDDLHNNLNRNNENKYYIPFEFSLTGTLDLSTFPHLEKLTVKNQFINRLVLTNCYLLKTLNANDNLLRKIVWPTRTLETIPQLECIYLTNNNFPPKNLLKFSNFPHLKALFLGTEDRERIRQNIYNRWNGSLSFIRNLDQLQELDINATDINDGLIDLPTEELFHFTFGSFGRERAGVNRLKAILARDLRLGEGNIEEWAVAGTYARDVIYNRHADKIELIQDWQERQFQAQIQV